VQGLLHVRWRRAGIWDQIMDALAVAHDATVQMIDTSIIHVHQLVPSSPITAAIVVFLIKPGGSKIIIHLFFNDLPLPTRRGKFCCLLLQPKIIESHIGCPKLSKNCLSRILSAGDAKKAQFRLAFIFDLEGSD
jgi:hypothetical protein